MAELTGSAAPPGDSLPVDGERFIPGSMTGEIELEHIHRYKFAAQLCAKRVVLDIACGEGYGSAYLAEVAWRVIGVDISASAIDHARAKYQRPNLEFTVGDCSQIPLGTGSVDVVVSFETIEHIAEQEAMLREIRRVLRPRGTLVISSPDKLEYADKPGIRNPFHVKELYKEEFGSLLGKHFKHVRFFGQRVLYGSALFLEAGAQEIEFHNPALDAGSHDALAAPRYWVGVASKFPLRRVKGGVLEGSAATLASGGELATTRATGSILKAIVGTDSSYLRSVLSEPWYLERNPDVVDKGVDPFEHWMKWGATEGRAPAPNAEALAFDLLAEREARLKAILEVRDRELRDARAEWQARQHALEEAQRQTLVERERAFAEQLTNQRRLAGEERDRERETARRELAAAHAEQQRGDQSVRAEFAQRERELDQRLQSLLDRERELSSQLEESRLAVRDQIAAQLRSGAERERAFAEQLLQQQRQSSDEHRRELQAANALTQLILSQREQAEQRMQATISDREREIRNLQRETVEQQKAMQATLAQHRIALQYAADSRTRALEEQQRASAELLSQQQKLANEELEVERQAAANALTAARTEHQKREERARTELEGMERELADARTEHARREERTRSELEKRERELALSKEVDPERERALESELEQTRLAARNEAEARLQTLADRERAFGERLNEQQRQANEALAQLAEEAAQRLAETHADHRTQLQTLGSQLSALQSREREQAAAHLKLLLEREHVFSQELSRVRAQVDEQRRLLRAQFLHATDAMREQLTASESRPWWRKMLTPWMSGPLASALLRTWISCATDTMLDGKGEESQRWPLAPSGKPNSVGPVRSLAELLARDDQDFVSCMYLSLLGRTPDPKGYRFYLEQLRSTGDKAELIAQVASSKEAKERPISLVGLKSFLLRRNLARLPLLHWVGWRADVHGEATSPKVLLEEVGRRIAALHEDIRQGVAQPAGRPAVAPNDYVSAVFAAFDAGKYIAANPDVRASGINPYEHLIRFGWDEGRAQGGEAASQAATGEPDFERSAEQAADVPSGPWSSVMQAVMPTAPASRYPLTRLMHFVWSSRLDLREAFDIDQESGRLGLLNWFARHGIEEYGLDARVFPRNLLNQLAEAGVHLGSLARRAPAQLSPEAGGGTSDIVDAEPSFGANLVGYAFGEFGRGEDVRMLARSLDRLRVPFCIINQDPGLHGTRDDSAAHWVTDGPRYLANVFLVNADLFPFLPFKLGTAFPVGRHNIGYWAWELPRWPSEFTLALAMVDEVWAISEFVAESVRIRARVPVFTMPNAVTVPGLGPQYTKSHYGLPPGSFVFYFVFDGASHIDRKNPVAAVRAFKRAFYGQSPDDVHLLVKAMNVEAGGILWKELLTEIADDNRITVFTDRMTREEVLGLHVACDAFVSLHRSEGFGRCIAEAMAYGRPVIVTNYSGSRDFAHEGTACVVDYRLVPVPADSYPFSADQVWAEPDVAHAASLMQRIARDAPYRQEIAAAGQRCVLENFSEEAVGRLYARRLLEISALRTAEKDADEPSGEHGGVNNGIFGYIDNPPAGSSPQVSEMLSIEGWTTSREAIESVKVFIDDAYVSDAHYGILRPDVHSAFADFPGAGRSGFCLLVNLAEYADGAHSYRVRACGRGGASKTWDGSFIKTPSTSYSAWKQRTSELYRHEFEGREVRSTAVSLSVAVRVAASTTVSALTETFTSLANQGYPAMELICLLADEAQESVVKLVARRANLQPTCLPIDRGNWIAALNQCRGDFIGVVDPGDTFRPFAFRIIEKAVLDNSSLDLLYADEETCGAAGTFEPLFKPGWSPIFLESYNYIGRAWFASRTRLQAALSRWAAADAGSLSEHELLKTIGIGSSTIAHVPTVLVSCGSVSRPEAAPEQMDHTCADQSGAGSEYPRVSIVIPTALGNEEIVSRCFDSLERATDYANFEVIVVVNNVRNPAAVERHLSARPFKVLHWDGAFNWARINNFGASRADGDLLLFMNDDIEPLEPKWLQTLVRTLISTGAGATGCLLKYRNGTIQHAGVNFVNYGGGARHLFRFCTGNEARLQWLLKYPREVSAVTGACLLTTRECFNEVSGFDNDLPLVGNDTDFCLRVWQSRRPVVLDPHTRLIHYEGISRQGMPEEKDVERFWSKWKDFLDRGDFFTNPNLDMSRDDWFVDPEITRVFPVRTTVMP